MSGNLDTIAAIATAPQNGAIGIIRLSGAKARAVLEKIFYKADGSAFQEIHPRYFHFGKILNRQDQTLDEALCVYMPGPKSFTGEDVVEIHAHGNLILLKSILREILSYSDEFSLRAALPGEFTRRAFLNGRMDLTQAEAVHEIITAESEAALKSSLSNLDGALKKHISALKDELKVSLALVEASFEFPEEDIQTFDRHHVFQLIEKTVLHLQSLAQAFATSKLYDQGLSVALVGEPNVGKSSLLNAILVEERAIVTEIAGTTRDVIEGSKILAGVRVIFRDTAGIRETSDIVEAAGIERSQDWIRKSDLVFWITDDAARPNCPDSLKALTKNPIYRVLNKVDLIPSAAKEKAALKMVFDLVISAQSGEGLEDLERLLLAHLDKDESVQNLLHVNERQFQKISEVLNTLTTVQDQNGKSLCSEEVLAEELRHMIQSLEEITGEISNEDVLGEIFQRFCIGK
jgi:tRNA modification GTPase